jgi:hypothetical protein
MKDFAERSNHGLIKVLSPHFLEELRKNKKILLGSPDSKQAPAKTSLTTLFHNSLS